MTFRQLCSQIFTAIQKNSKDPQGIVRLALCFSLYAVFDLYTSTYKVVVAAGAAADLGEVSEPYVTSQGGDFTKKRRKKTSKELKTELFHYWRVN